MRYAEHNRASCLPELSIDLENLSIVFWKVANSENIQYLSIISGFVIEQQKKFCFRLVEAFIIVFHVMEAILEVSYNTEGRVYEAKMKKQDIPPERTSKNPCYSTGRPVDMAAL